jgi:hypothetical protein
MLILGDKVDWQGDQHQLTRDWRYWLVAILGAAIAFGADYLMQAELAKYGYGSSHTLLIYSTQNTHDTRPTHDTIEVYAHSRIRISRDGRALS